MRTVRLATEADAAGILAVYAPYIRDTAVTFETETPSVDDTDTMDTPSSGHSSIQALNSSSASAALRPSARHDPCKITRCMSILSERITARHYSPPCHLPPFPLSQHSTNEPTITNSASPAPPHLCEVVSIQPVARSRQPVHVSLFKSGKFSQVFDIERLRRPLGSRKCRDTR